MYRPGFRARLQSFGVATADNEPAISAALHLENHRDRYQDSPGTSREEPDQQGRGPQRQTILRLAEGPPANAVLLGIMKAAHHASMRAYVA